MEKNILEIGLMIKKIKMVKWNIKIMKNIMEIGKMI